MKAETKNILIRVSPELGEQILEISKNDRRPLNTAIILLLESAIREKNRKRSKKGNTEHNTPDPR